MARPHAALPRGPHRLARDEVLASQRGRMQEACFLAAYDAGVEILMATVRGAGDELRPRIRALLGTLAAEPGFASTFVIEVVAAGPRALERRRAVHDAFAALTGDAPEALACVGATNELVAREIGAGRTAALPALEDLVVSIYERLLQPGG